MLDILYRNICINNMYGYIYLITNRVNGKIYVGQHKYDKMELDTNYHGSGKKLWNAYNKYGIDKFDTTLIDTADTKEELDQKETFYIDALDCRNPDVGYNIAEGGGGVSGLCGEKNGFHGKQHTDETKQKMSESHKGKTLSEDTKRKISENHSDASGENNPMYGKHQTEESKQKISDGTTGGKNGMAKKCPYNGIMFDSKIEAYNYAKDYCGYDKSCRTFYNQFKG